MADPAVRAFVLALMATMQARIDELEAKVERVERELGKRDKFSREEPVKDPEAPPARKTSSRS